LIQGNEHVLAEHRGQVYLNGWEQIIHVDVRVEGPASGISGYIVVSGARASAGLEGRNEGRGGSIVSVRRDDRVPGVTINQLLSRRA